MGKYKINIIFNEENDIDDILIKVLSKELNILLNNNCTYLSLKKEGGII